ncbi:MAG: hypothetical protein J2P25_23650 [Nocardiopsaceae bacterium]|nr:hypothetical protein [Nocardiopsaceae bacterium]
MLAEAEGAAEEGPGRLRVEAVDALTADEALLLAGELPHLRGLIYGEVPGLDHDAARKLAVGVLTTPNSLPAAWPSSAPSAAMANPTKSTSTLASPPSAATTPETTSRMRSTPKSAASGTRSMSTRRGRTTMAA